MSYEEFLEYVRENILEYLNFEPESVAELHTIVKNNGIAMVGLHVRRPGEQMAPNMYLNPYYKEYENGTDIGELLERIAKQYLSCQRQIGMEPEDIASFEKIKDSIILRVIGYELNKEQLQNCPYIMLEDMAITFRWLVSMEPSGLASVLLSNKELELWGISKEALYILAIQNTKRTFPAQIKPLGNLLIGYLEDVVQMGVMDEKEVEEVREEVEDYMVTEELDPPLYVLTNASGINGATCLLYDDVLQGFAEHLGHNLYILPSSIHEVILIPDNGHFDVEEMRHMVQDANNTVVSAGDVLTNSVYYFDRDYNGIKKL